MSRLDGTVVATTRDGDRDDPLVSALRAEGARVLVWPTISFHRSRDPEALRACAAGIHAFDWVVFTSARGAISFVEHVDPAPSEIRVAAVGPSTARALREARWPVTAVGSGGAEELVVRLSDEFRLDGARMLFPAGSRARNTLEEELRRRGAVVERVEAYHTRQAPPDADAVRRDLAAGVDIVTFTSPSAVRSLAEALGRAWPSALLRCQVVTIGETTAASAREHGLLGVSAASGSTLSGLVDACALTLQRG